jgi:signal transduction histidine kinase
MYACFVRFVLGRPRPQTSDSRPWQRTLAIDLVITLPVFALMLAEIHATSAFGHQPDNKAVATVIGCVGVLPLAFRRNAPLGSLLVLLAATAIGTVIAPDYQSFSLFLAWIVGTYSVAAHEPNDRALWGLLAAALMTGFVAAAGGFADQSTIISVWIFLGAAWGLGRGIRSRDERAQALQARAEHLTAEQESQAQRAIAEERRRIARELHDVVAHDVSVMVVQAGAAQRVLSQDPERAREAMFSIETSGRQALVELRRMLGVLRASDARGSIEPQPVLARVGELVEHVRDAGIEAGLHIEGEPRGLSAGADLAGYRIVQEALTNVLKHAGATAVDITIRYSPAALELNIRDNGGGRRDERAPGHGLIGMRERVAMFGGTLSAGKAPEGGFAVAAHIPLESEAP